MPVLHVVSIGNGVTLDLLDRLAPRLARKFGLSCHVHTSHLDPAFALDVRRNQYYSTPLIRALADSYPVDTRVLGVTSVDLFVPILTFVFGEAQVNGRAALVSLHRLKEEFYGLPADTALLFDRLVKEAVHELGHTYGLRHCSDWRCVMKSSHAVEVMDVKTADFCDECAPAVYKG